MKAIYLPGDPVSQKRPRVFGKGAMDPCWEAKTQHKSYIKAHYPKVEMAKEPIHATFIFCYAYLKGFPKKRLYPQHKESRPDIDNLSKYIMDMGNGTLWEDDSLIVSHDAIKMFFEESCTIVIIKNPSLNFMDAVSLIGIAKA